MEAKEFEKKERREKKWYKIKPSLKCLGEKSKCTNGNEDVEKKQTWGDGSTRAK